MTADGGIGTAHFPVEQAKRAFKKMLNIVLIDTTIGTVLDLRLSNWLNKFKSSVSVRFIISWLTPSSILGAVT